MLQYLRPQGSYCIDCCSYRSLIKATLFPLLLLTSLISSAQEPNSWKIASLEWPPYASAEMDKADLKNLKALHEDGLLSVSRNQEQLNKIAQKLVDFA